MAMNTELDLLLASYLDEELEPEPRQLVETLLRSDPAVAARFTTLGRVRDLVATLSAPEAFPDVSGEVLAIVFAQRRTTWRNWKFAGSIAAGLAAAALLLFWNFGTGPRKHEIGPNLAKSDTPRPRLVLPLPMNMALAPQAVPLSMQALPIRQNVLKAEVQARDSRLELVSLLKQGEVRLINVIVDDLGPASLKLVDAAIDDTSRVRPKHAKVHVVQGMEIDPAHPGKACVYVLLMDEFEYGRFREQLQARLPDSMSKPVAAPVTALDNLATIGRIEILDRKVPASTLKPPDLLFIARRPHKFEQSKQKILGSQEGEGQPLDLGQAGSLKEKDAPDRLGIAAKPTRTSESSTRAVFVVWVSPRDRTRP